MVFNLNRCAGQPVYNTAPLISPRTLEWDSIERGVIAIGASVDPCLPDGEGRFSRARRIVMLAFRGLFVLVMAVRRAAAP